MSEEKDTPSRIQRLRERYRWLDHLVRAAGRYQDRYGDHYAAAVTYFSVLSLVPMLMIAFSIAGFVLVNQPDLLEDLREAITKAVPGELGGTLNEVVAKAVDERGTVGIIGLLTAAYSGLGWMSNLRDALTAQWDANRPDRPFLRTVLFDLLALLGLGLAMVVSFGLTAAGGFFAKELLELVGLAGAGWAEVSLRVLAILLSVSANWMVFLWVLARLPREPVTLRSAMKGALFAAVGFELLKQLGGIYLRSVTSSPSGAAFGSVIGLLVFANLVSRFVLFVTAWTATARENMRTEPVPAPPPAVIRPNVYVRKGPNVKMSLSLVGLGALLAFAFRSRRRP